MPQSPTAPILDHKDWDAPSMFEPAALIREARRQRDLPDRSAPSLCVLDPDGDMVRRLRRTGAASRIEHWPCYHSEMFGFELAGRQVGIIGCAVGAPYAVLIAEQLFACGCQHLISVTSAGRISGAAPPPYFVIIDKALRDEGASYHYAPPAEFAAADPALVTAAAEALRGIGCEAVIGASWTTDAPFRETEAAIAAARERGVLAVEMEAAALYAFAAARGASVLCLAHVTNDMGRDGDDFEKGEADGAAEALAVLEALAAARFSLSG